MNTIDWFIIVTGLAFGLGYIIGEWRGAGEVWKMWGDAIDKE